MTSQPIDDSVLSTVATGRPTSASHLSGPGSKRRPSSANALDVVRDAFNALMAHPRPLTLDGREFPTLPDRDLPLLELRSLLLDRSCPQSTRDTAWRQLATRSREQGGAWTIGCAGMALPALITITAQLTAWYGGDSADIASAVLTGFLASLASADLERPRVMLRMRWAAYRSGHAALAEAVRAPLPVAPAGGALIPTQPSAHPDFVLASAVSDCAITSLEADVIGGTRLDRIAVTDWAAAHGMGTWAVYKLRKRAEQRLVSYLLDAGSETGVGAVAGSPAASLARGARPGLGSRRVSTELSKTDIGAGVQLRRQVLPADRVPEDPRCA